jgi:hypothetical protein
MRKREVVVVPEWGGRDKGKHFEIQEAPALKAEKWFWRFSIVLKGTSAAIPEDLVSYGMAAMAIMTARAVNAFLAADIDFVKLEPLLDELLECVNRIRNPAVNDRTTGQPHATPLVGDDDIEEVKTIIWLRSEVLRVHSNFSLADGLSTLVSAITKPSEVSPTT